MKKLRKLKHGKKGKSAKKNSLRDPKNAAREMGVLGHSNPPVPALIVGENATDTREERALNPNRFAASDAKAEIPESLRAEEKQERSYETREVAEGVPGTKKSQPGDLDWPAGANEETGNSAVSQATGEVDAENVVPRANTKTQIRNRDSREALLNAALYLFWEKGYGETKMQDVYDRSGVKSGSMYYFFRTKEELLLAVLDRLAEILYPALLAPVWEVESDPIERIFGLLDVYRKGILASNFNYGCPVGRLAVEVSGDLVEVHKKIAMNFEGWSKAVQKCLEDAGSRLPKGMDLKMLSHFVLTVMEGGVMQSRSYKSIEPFDQGVAQLRDYFDRLEAQGRAEVMQAGGSYWDLPKKKKRGPFPR